MAVVTFEQHRSPTSSVRGNGPGRSAYGRRRLMAVVLVSAFALAGLHTAVGAEPIEPEAPPSPPATSIVVARPGDSLWSIARRHDPDGDLRALVDTMGELNGSAALTVGQGVVVPAR